MDAAIALTSTANVGTSTPPDGYGAPSAITTPAFIGQPVQKYGRTTGFQLGTVAAGEPLGRRLLHRSSSTSASRRPGSSTRSRSRPASFSAAGDSGSLIVTQSGNQPVALLFAGGDGLTIGTPIDPVLQRFGVTIDGSPPQDGPPGAPTSLSALAGDALGLPLLDRPPPSTAARRSRATRCTAARAPAPRRFLGDAGGADELRRHARPPTGRPTTTRCPPSTRTAKAPLSNEASATPTDLVPPAEPLPALDSFNRANESPLSDGGSLVERGQRRRRERSLRLLQPARLLGHHDLHRLAQQRPVRARRRGLGAHHHASGDRQRDPPVRCACRRRAPRATTATCCSRTSRPAPIRPSSTASPTAARVTCSRSRRSSRPETRSSSAPTAPRSRPGATTAPPGRDSVSCTTRRTPAPGYVGVGIRGTTGRLDDFGARTTQPEPARRPHLPLRPRGDASVSLSWIGPRLRRRLADHGLQGVPRHEPRLRRRSSPTRRADELRRHGRRRTGRPTTTRCPPSTRTAKARSRTRPPQRPPTSSRPPSRFPLLDSFNRANESPLSDAGRWSNAVNGGVENGLNVSSNQLACSVTTTCTAWRNNAQYGPDAEVWARITTLPGTGNGIRLYAARAVAGHLGLRRLRAAHEPAGRNRPGPSSTASPTAAFVTLLTVSPGARRRRHDPPPRRGLHVRGLAPRRRLLVTTRRRARLDLRRRRATSASASAGRPVGSTTSGRGRWVRLRPTPRLRPHRRTSGRERRRARARSTSPGRPPPTTSASPCTGSSAARAPAAPSFAEIATTTRSTSYSEHRPRRLDHLLLPRARRGRGPEPGRTRTRALGDDAGSARHRGSDRTREPAARAPSSSSQIDLTWRPPPTTSASPCTGSSAARAPAAPSFAEIATTTSAPSYSEHRPQPPRRATPTACAPRTPALNRGRTRTRALGDDAGCRPTPRLRPPREPLARAPSSSSQIDLTWAAATDNVGVTLYRIERCQGAGCSELRRDRDHRLARATRTPASPPRRATPTACAPRTRP